MTFVGVCGGRNYGDSLCENHEDETNPDPFCGACDRLQQAERDLLDRVLQQELREGDVVVQGGAHGADYHAQAWAERNGFESVTCHANWAHFRRAAGMRRNAVIAALPLRLLIAFPGGAGTAGMVKLARARGIPVLEVTQP